MITMVIVTLTTLLMHIHVYVYWNGVYNTLTHVLNSYGGMGHLSISMWIQVHYN